jgi:hypothetical protein
MTDTRNTSCDERIDANLASRIEDLEGLMNRINGDDVDDGDEAQEELDEFALSMELRTTMVVQISTGGPGDQFEIAVVNNGHGWELDADKATYRFLDWFDGSTRTTDDPAVMAYLANMVERMSY